MQRTQVQLPDALYREAKRIAEEQEISLAEVVRRGLEHMLRIYPPGRSEGRSWEPPAARSLGELRAPVEEWRELAHEIGDPA